ncbi:transcriptional regulator, TetR family [Bizionia echini]|uniref:Transcriptional regulator, TetR family n=1 Tax=Bizionia echini TaxID=649333 RepID=A0A1I5AUD9_9FLAO|nr:TetR/AcrR family transcriptional regulator [Bizionia echini]SFN66031.1 transcriptional regulator, TetR family [Bizionia echini]
MKNLLSNVKIIVPEIIYIKDPESTDLGKRIIEHSIILIDDLGFDNFTFKKLGTAIESNESSIYRYFESKHKVLLYLTSWYWAWIEYQLVFETHSISNSEEKLKKAIQIFSAAVIEDSNYSHINEVALNRIVINENSKSFSTKEVDKENKEGYFIVYKRIINRLGQLILDVNKDYEYPLNLASNIIEGSLHQHFLMHHFSTLTNCKKNNDSSKFFIDLALKALK